MPVLRVDKANVNDTNKRYINLLKEAKVESILNDNIAESNIDQYGSHINESDLLLSISARPQISTTPLGIYIEISISL